MLQPVHMLQGQRRETNLRLQNEEFVTSAAQRLENSCFVRSRIRVLIYQTTQICPLLHKWATRVVYYSAIALCTWRWHHRKWENLKKIFRWKKRIHEVGIKTNTRGKGWSICYNQSNTYRCLQYCAMKVNTSSG